MNASKTGNNPLATIERHIYDFYRHHASVYPGRTAQESGTLGYWWSEFDRLTKNEKGAV